jgi:uncharacterized protein (DUF302 family)
MTPDQALRACSLMCSALRDQVRRRCGDRSVAARRAVGVPDASAKLTDMASHLPQASAGVVTKPCPRSVAATISRLRGLIEDKGLKLFALIDHSGEATGVGLTMPDTKLVVFGSPTAGTPVMVATPLAALDLPLKVLVWEDSAGRVSVSYNSPAYLAERHHLSEDMRARFEPIESITDTLVAVDG